MAKRETRASRLGRQYGRELRLSLRNNSGAYGYSVMMTCTLAMVSSVQAPPEPTQIMLFLVGAVVSFAVIESIATRGFTRPLVDEEPSEVVALASSLSLVSIGVAVGAAGLLATVVPAPVSWPATAFVASVIYLVASGGEMAIARRIEQLRNIR